MTVRIAVARATEPLVVPTKSSQLDTHWADLQHGVVDFLHEIGTPEFVRSQGQNKIQRSLWGAAAKRSSCLAKRTPAVSYPPPGNVPCAFHESDWAILYVLNRIAWLDPAVPAGAS